MKAESIKNIILAGFSTVGSAIAAFLGGWDAAVAALVVFLAVDFVTGLAVALVFRRSGKTADGSANSGACFRGLLKKIAVLLFVGIGALLDGLLGSGGLCRNAVILFFIGNEGLSICENLGLMGIPLPAFMRNAFEVLREKNDSASEKEERHA